MIVCSTGKIGSVSVCGLRLRPLCCVNVSTPRLACCLPNHVRAALPRVERQCEGEARFATDWMTFLKLLNFLHRPSVIAIRIVAFEQWNVARRIM
jgi:hypothetical protein